MSPLARGLIGAGIGVALTVAAGAAIVAAPADRPDPAVAHTATGDLRGTVTDEVRTFQGIPYAAPPVDALRWEPPAPAADWDGERDATTPGAACPQPADLPISMSPTDEDCLYLNVTTPADARPGDDLPVIVWIHGGSLTYGDGAGYGAARLAEQGDVVVVTVNYRLGVFGFLSHPDLPGHTANLGLLDQRAAFEWVRANATAFGGDAGNVTAMGQSGGGYSVCAQLASPGSAGLFDRAIVHSAGCVGSADATMDLDTARANGVAIATAAECDGADPATCLRAADTEALIAAAGGGHSDFRPVVDGDVLPTDLTEAFSTGEFHRVPVLYGSNRHEESGRLGGIEIATGTPLDAQGYLDQVTATFGDDAPAVLAEYPPSDYASPGEALTAVLTDANWSRHAWRTAETLSEYTPVYAFEITQSESPWWRGMDRPSFPLGTGHMAEMAYLFEYPQLEDLDASQRRLSRDMIDYWTAFAAAGDPNHRGAPRWDHFTATAPYTQGLAADAHGIGESGFAEYHHLEFWAGR
ncbi:para-nitrobenzyl esterase [Stackebrandtia albiflava]|uniref:Para-nitrobenzyl esterase n=1 Tax=Stackebrandtia albiflava TaxID=406432 RepID=A0A562V2W3_9ACTN|nr:carboxylesterase family protein [Stackebrandtia albiflava]TWJ12195.1 para-nitrobenzyl esterase [Stackebrandtia albiflava]